MAPNDALAEELVGHAVPASYVCPVCHSKITDGDSVYAYIEESGEYWVKDDIICGEHNPMFPTDRVVIGEVAEELRCLVVTRATALDTSDPANLRGETIEVEHNGA